ncbi:MAG: hypothetical protein SGJ27_03300 [Candidatus Melainabacteria bacterium]|nr:hypothetical protein [Candidatus Melainabacteria bacterium]
MLDWILEKSKEERGGGGGGTARIRFGNTGPKGRMYGNQAKGARGTTAIVKSKYIKQGKGARPAIREHLRYIQERERGEHEPERKFFDRDRKDLERGEVFEKMLENRGDRTAMHTLILSPGDNNINMQEYTRTSMEALEERMGHKLDWYATIHENTDHYHAHVVIAGKVPGWEREVERREAKRWEQSYKQAVEKELSWSNRDAELRALLGEGYDEKAQTDPREDRRAEYEFGHGTEAQPTDPRVQELLGDNPRSWDELKTERMIECYERQMAARETAGERCEVYLDVNDLRELRSAGNDYVNRERSIEHSLDRAYEREFGHELERDRFKERDLTKEPERGSFEEVSRFFEMNREVEHEQEHSYERGTSRERDQDDRDDDREQERERDRGDDDGRGR